MNNILHVKNIHYFKNIQHVGSTKLIKSIQHMEKNIVHVKNIQYFKNKYVGSIKDTLKAFDDFLKKLKKRME